MVHGLDGKGEGRPVLRVLLLRVRVKLLRNRIELVLEIVALRKDLVWGSPLLLRLDSHRSLLHVLSNGAPIPLSSRNPRG